MAALPDDYGPWAAPPPPPPRPQPIGVVGSVRCPYCGGNAWGDGESVRCLMCARTVAITDDGPSGRPQALGSDAPPRPLRRTEPRIVEEQRIARGVGRSQGETGMKARLLRAIPEEPAIITAWALGRPIRTSTEEVRFLLQELIELGLVREVEYQAGAVRSRRKARGYQRPRVEGP